MNEEQDKVLLARLECEVKSTIDYMRPMTLKDGGVMDISGNKTAFQTAAVKRAEEILEVLQKDGLKAHPLLNPVANAMIQIPSERLEFDEDIAIALIKLFEKPDTSPHPWKALAL